MKILKWKSFLEGIVGEEGISNIDQYIDRMDLSIDDKLFFLDKVDFDVIVDFGCANGTLLSKIRIAKPGVKLIGYDLDDVMVDKARHLLGEEILITKNWSEIAKELVNYKAPLLNLSSVIHEVYSYSPPDIIKRFWNDIVFSGMFKYIVIRDMMPSTKIDDVENFEEDILKIREKADAKQLEEFENIWGYIDDSYKTLSHFLLKYRYLDNWNREVKENYFPLSLESMKHKITSGYKINYEEKFSVPFIQQQLKIDFDVQLKESTHTKLIIENIAFKNPSL